MTFDALGLSESLVLAAKSAGFENPFPVQEKVIPVILSGKDVMGLAQTGSGKTASFVLPVLEKLEKQHTKRDRNINVLVLVPTRELAVQIEGEFQLFSRNLKRNIKTMAVFGGVSINPQMMGVIGVEVLIATPGRLLDLIAHNALGISQIQQLIIDEADKMFQMGFDGEMDQLISLMPKKKQVALFSATLNDKVEEMKKRLGINPVFVEIDREEVDLDKITQKAYLVNTESKGPFLRYLIKENKMEQVLIFVSSKRTADNLVEKLKKNGIPARSIHGEKAQGARTKSLDGFKKGDVKVLVATDLIGRGIHIDALPYVINFELPRSPLDYVHRIGRTGRANETGQAITILSEDELQHFRVIQKKMGKRVELENAREVNLHGY
jgi:ATP-dependent RNA helicase RhlE